MLNSQYVICALTFTVNILALVGRVITKQRQSMKILEFNFDYFIIINSKASELYSNICQSTGMVYRQLLLYTCSGHTQDCHLLFVTVQ